MKTSELGMTSKRWIAEVFRFEQAAQEWFSFWLIGSNDEPSEAERHFSVRVERYLKEIGDVDVLDVQWQDMSKLQDSIQIIETRVQTVRNAHAAKYGSGS